MSKITITENDIPDLIDQLNSSGKFRVISKFEPPNSYNGASRPQDASELKVLMVVDTETTGLLKDKDKIIEIGYLLAEFDPKIGRVFNIIERMSAFEDPGEPLTDIIKKVTGIKDEDLKGHAFDDKKINEAIAKADVVIAHNAGFDRAFLERRFPAFESKWWCCSQKEAPWDVLGISSSKQEYIAYALARVFYSAHRALTDAEVLLHILTVVGVEEKTILGSILEKSRKTSCCVWALASPWDKREVLKAHNYRWHEGSGNCSMKPVKTWYRDYVDLEELDAEMAMLRTEVYPQEVGQIGVEFITGRERYTSRSKKMDCIDLSGRQGSVL